MMTHAQLIEFLKQPVGLCKNFSDDRLDGLVRESRVVSYEPEEAVVEFGEDAAFLGVLLEGDLAVCPVTGAKAVASSCSARFARLCAGW
ncbi:MAG TPA: hypothetical protein PKY77_20700 [Phycisphaerae bacterium]|nr:hypothetical protein [Phycisphaerae bacterium]HRY70623.1 hypothetical protein [Phycisphaerae bacterium]HSA28936.1 hypothetical protein [Phycisphaerae bacterium]